MKAAVAIQKRLKEKIELVSYDNPQAEETLVLAGCPTACVGLKPFEGLSLWAVTSS